MNIAIWGTGAFAGHIAEQLKENSLYEIKCFIDSNAEKPGFKTEFFGIEIISPAVFQAKLACDVELVLVCFLRGAAILEQLRNMPVKKFGFVSDRVYDLRLTLSRNIEEDTNIIWHTDILPDSACLPYLQVNLVDHCNLSCKGCSHFSNLFSGEKQLYNYTAFEKDIKTLAKKIFIARFDFVGGEPFLCDTIADYVKCVRRYMPKTEMNIYSNGLLIPNHVNEEVFLALKEYSVCIVITEYPPTTKIKTQIEDTLCRYQVPYIMGRKVAVFGKNLDLSGENDPWEAQRNCREYTCQFLRNGKIYKCPFAALHKTFFSHYGLDIEQETGLDIASETDWKESLRQLYCKPIELCRYCGKEEQFDWEISRNPSLNDWVINSKQDTLSPT